jgi:transposase
MELLHPRCAGLDVHAETVVACARLVNASTVEHRVETFATTMEGLLKLSEWLEDSGCTHVAMEATGVYWKPVWHVLEESFELVLANAAHVKNVPGRKTDVNDATWLADLHAHGLIRASFVPEQPIQELRTLMRTRKQLMRETSRHVQRIQKTLEDANLKLTEVVSDVVGQSGRAMLDALIKGETNPESLAELAKGKMRAKLPELRKALRGNVTTNHRFVLRLHLQQVDALQAAVVELDAEVGRVLEPFHDAAELLKTMPGISDTTARVIVAEIGIDMSRFPSAAQLRSWAGLCPRSDESAGKRRSTRIKHGAPWLKTHLVQAALAASRKRNSYFRALFLRIKARRGAQKAIVAVAASMLTSAYHMLKNGTVYEELSPAHFDELDKRRATRRLVRRLEALGYNVDLKTAA